MSKRKNRKRSGGIAREDYTQGGRVGYREGEEAVKEYLDRQKRNDITNLTNNVDGGGKPFTPGFTTPVLPNVPSVPGGEGNGPFLETKPATQPTPAPTPAA